MNYRHGYHAGNFADVIKHVALVAILQHLKKKDAAFAVVDSHAGRGRYDLGGAEAGKTGEARNGIARLTGMSGAMPEALATYLSLARQNHAYPGSPLIAAQLLRSQDRLTAIEKHSEEFAVLKDVLMPFGNAAVENADGYARAAKLLPPPARRGLVLMDPPFESPDEFSALAQALREGARKFATGIFLAWYPIKSQAEADGFTGEVLAGGIAKALVVDTKITAPEGRLGRAGLLVINPPYGFAGTMQDVAGAISPRLDTVLSVQWITGSE
jgi:23S rRNA (adenine2030-N6)-methyltransferase